MKIAALLTVLVAAWLAWRISGDTPDSPLRREQPTGPHEGRVSALSLGDPLASGDVTGRVVLWRANGRPLHSWVAHDGPVRRIIRHSGGLITVGADGTVAAWGAEGDRRWRRRLRGQILNDGVMLGSDVVVAAAKGTVARLGPDGTRWQARGAHGRAAFALAWHDGRLFSGGADGRVAERDPKTGVVLREWAPGVGSIIALNPDGEGLLAVGQRGVAYCDGDGAVEVLTRTQGLITTAVGDGVSLLWGTEEGHVVHWTGTEARRWTVGEPVLVVAKTDQRAYAGGETAGRIRVWQMKDGKSLATLPGVRKESP